MPVIFPHIRRRFQNLRRGLRCAAAAFSDEWGLRYDVTACLKFKNVARYLPEWLEFHQTVGIEHFFLYNNNSTDDYAAVLAPYVQDGIVTLHDWPEVPAFPSADEHCIKNYGHLARWIAFIDDDEFLFPVKGNSLPKVLSKYRAYPAVAVYWLMFGSSGHQRRPDGLVISNYTKCASGPNGTVKSIVNPRRLQASKSTHYWIYKDNAYAVDETYSTVKTSTGSGCASISILRINHYWAKSYEDGLAKMGRGWVDNWGYENPRDMDRWKEIDAIINNREDKTILRFEAAVKERLAKRMAAR